MNQSPILYRLQNIDTQLDKIDFRLGEIKSLKDLDSSVHQTEEKMHIIDKNRKEAFDALHKIEEDLKVVRIKMDTNEASLYHSNIRNPKELQDLQTENESIKKRIESMENEQLEAMFVLEQFDQELKIASLAVAQSKADLIVKNSGWSGEETQLNLHKETLLMERNALVGSIETENLKLYDRLRAQKRGIAVTCIEDNTCGACGSEMRPAELQIARSPQQMAFCSSCGRILYSG